jgi:alpha-galactosidase
MKEFTSILRTPDRVYGATENSSIRFEEEFSSECPVKYDYIVSSNSAKVIVYPSGSPVKYLKFRFRGDFSKVTGVLGDKFERASMLMPIEWKLLLPENRMPWFFYVKNEKRMACYGVKTGADCFAYWYLDPKGISLVLNLNTDTRGVDLKEPLLACEVVELLGGDGEDAYSVASRFASVMCDNPVLPKTPMFGGNNWYWAYGDINRDIVLKDADYIKECTDGVKNRPCMVIDDGWQYNRPKMPCGVGGPWEANALFGDMSEVADRISERGLNPGLWFRPLLTTEEFCSEMVLKEEFTPGFGGYILDPSHPAVIEKIYNDAKKIRDWGYTIIKHDFTTIDMSGNWNQQIDTPIIQPNRKMFDNTKTAATIIKNIYKAIQSGAGDGDVIGCNVYGHLSAGIHSMQRVGGDTSGKTFEITRAQGINSMMRLPLNNKFFLNDPDCPAFTRKVDTKTNLDFLEMCALTDCTTIASITPGILNEKEMKRINEIFKMADKGNNGYIIKDFDKTNCPDTIISADKKDQRHYDWYSALDGIRSVYSWDEKIED